MAGMLHELTRVLDRVLSITTEGLNTPDEIGMKRNNKHNFVSPDLFGDEERALS